MVKPNLHFESDYMEGAHPKILERLSAINLEKNTGYGLDKYCESARKKILAACGVPKGAVHFLVGGTQTNSTVIASVLKPWQGVVAATTGHISVHESGAVEATGHKVIELSQKDGKLSAERVEKFLKTYHADGTKEHIVEPGMVYISHPTETGTLYTKDELKALHSVCSRYHIPLFMDGARLGYGLAAEKTDVTLKTIAKTCDIFYIGGTKVGAFFGEAVVVPKPEILPHFFSMMKQHGALLAKGFLLGVQFDTLFTDNLYLKIAKNAIECAMIFKRELKKKGIKLYADSYTNQQFFILKDEDCARIARNVGMQVWEKLDSKHTAVRLVTSWATKRSDVLQAIEYFK